MSWSLMYFYLVIPLEGIEIDQVSSFEHYVLAGRPGSFRVGYLNTIRSKVKYFSQAIHVPVKYDGMIHFSILIWGILGLRKNESQWLIEAGRVSFWMGDGKGDGYILVGWDRSWVGGLLNWDRWVSPTILYEDWYKLGTCMRIGSSSNERCSYYNIPTLAGLYWVVGCAIAW